LIAQLLPPHFVLGPDTPAKERSSVIDSTHEPANQSKPNPALVANIQKAAESGMARAQKDLGVVYYNGLFGVTKDYTQAFEWLTKAAAQEDPVAEDFLARCYEEGHGVDQDETKAFYLFQHAADQGESYSQYRTGNSLIVGRLVKANPALGFSYLLHAACRNYPPAQWEVSDCYVKGVFVKPDLILAYKWAVLAATREPDTQNRIADLQKKLTPEQMNEGQHKVESWLQTEKEGSPQDKMEVSFENQASRAKFDFVFVNEDIYIPCLIQNHRAVYMIVDSGSSRSIIDTESAKALCLESNDYVAFAAFGNNLTMGTEISGIQLKISSMTFSGVQTFISPLSGAVSALSDPHPFGDNVPLGGLIGSDILNHFVIHIDFQNSTIEFIRPDDFHPNYADVGQPLDFHAMIPVITATILSGTKTSKPGNFIVDTGNGIAMSLSHVFSRTNRGLGLKAAIFSGVFGLGGPSPAAIGKCSSLEIGDISLANPVFYFAQPREDTWSSGTIGTDVWSRFDVTLDYPGKKIYLKKISDETLARPFTCNLYGMLIKQVGGVLSSVTVSKVWRGSAAEAAGIRQGDGVQKINGRDIGRISSKELQDLFNQEGTLSLVVFRDGHSHEITVKSSTLPTSG